MPIFIKQAISQGVRNQGHQGRLEALIESFSEVFLFKVNLQKKIQSRPILRQISICFQGRKWMISSQQLVT